MAAIEQCLKVAQDFLLYNFIFEAASYCGRCRPVFGGQGGLEGGSHQEDGLSAAMCHQFGELLAENPASWLGNQLPPVCCIR